MSERGSENGTFSAATRRAVVFIGLVAVALLIWRMASALVLVFVGVLIAVFLRGLARRLSERTPLSQNWALATVVTVLVVVLVGLGFLLGPRISDQMQQIVETLPESIDRLEQSVRGSPIGAYLPEEGEAMGGGSIPFGSDFFSRLTGAASQVFGGLIDILLVVAAAIFFAVDADLYKRGVLLLVPNHKKERIREVMDASGQALWKWLMARLVAMVFVGVSVAVGLWIVGVPLALTLGLLAGLFDFVPIVGPLAAAVPGILLGLTDGPATAFYAALVYLGVQQLEGNLITPLAQQKATSIPPVLELFAVVAGGMLLGILGMLVATPLVVVIMVVVGMLYVQDVLGKEVLLPGHRG